MYKIYITGNRFLIQDLNDNRLYEGLSKNVLLRQTDTTSTVIAFTGVNNWDKTKTIDFATDVDLTGAPYSDFDTFVTWCDNELGKSSPQASGIIYVNQYNYLEKLSNIEADKEYFFEEPVTFAQSITLDNDITIRSYGTAIPRIIAGGEFPIFTGNSAGNIFMYNIAIDNSFINSSVFDLSFATGFESLQLIDVNFVNSDGLGELNNFRQVFYNTVAYIGGKPSLTLSGNCGGVKITNFNGVNLSDTMTEPVFKAGSGLLFSSTFDAEGKIDLGSTAPLIDFSDVNILNDENLIFNNMTVSRNSVVNSTDTTIYPNIDQSSVKSLWVGNTGLPNTQKTISSRVTTEVITTVLLPNTYYDLLGTYTVLNQSHFNMPINGEFELLSGNGFYNIQGFFILESTQNDVIDIRLVKSIDGGITYPDEVYHRSGVINALSGARDVGFFNVNGVVSLKKGDRVKIQVENKTGANDITAELDSDITISNL